MHLTYVIGIAENFDFDEFHNTITNILHMVLVDTTMLPPHVLPQLEPYIPLKVDTLILHKIIMSIIPSGIRFFPSLEVFPG